MTVNAESAASEPPSAEPDDPASVGRIHDCAPGTADCDRDHANGCEATLADDPKNCGVCGTDCSAPNAESGCMGGTCRMIHCAAGFCDEDGEAENGCEVAEHACKPNVPPSP